jgi:type VI secretion system Hcp family effector
LSTALKKNYTDNRQRHPRRRFLHINLILPCVPHFIFKRGYDMPLSGFLTLGDIKGSATDADHKDAIAFHGLEWEINAEIPQSSGGRVFSRPQTDDISFFKYYDAASPKLTEAVLNGQAFKEAEFHVHRETGGVHLDYLTIKLTDVHISHYSLFHDDHDGVETRIHEQLALAFDTIDITFRQMNASGGHTDIKMKKYSKSKRRS